MNQVITPNDPLKSPEIQEMILSSRIGIIANALSERLGIASHEALIRFYESETCRRLHDKTTGLYLYSDLYIVDDFIIEQQGK